MDQTTGPVVSSVALRRRFPHGWLKCPSLKRRGAEITELALTLPLFLLLTFGIVEFGRMVMVGEVLTNAAREGSRVAVLPGGTDADCIAAIAHYLNAAKIMTYNTPTIVPSANSATAGTALTVTVSIPLDQASWIPPSWLKGKSLTSKVVMIKE
ncbi:MAG: pilus assembly protein [Planctomycetia bacterium]|nr:pilus assembly protein [Planctomycetia bacterium]